MREKQEQIEESLATRPLISVITVCYNAKTDLPATLDSVRAQEKSFFEYVVIDGASTDGSIELLDQNQDIIDCLISEKDSGIYDAMNKGIKKAKGQYLWFMNAGDTFYEPSTLAQVARYLLETKVDAVYGDAMWVNADYEALGLIKGSAPKSLDQKSFMYGMNVCHQSFVAKKSHSPFYDLNYKITADIDWIIKIVSECGTVKKLDLVFSNFLQGGFSSDIYTDSWKDRCRVLRKHYGFFPNIFNHLIIILRYLLQKLSKGKKRKE